MRIVLVIPARGNSKGIPRKNLQLLGGIPLVMHAIRIAKLADVGRVMVSTEDPEIRQVAIDAGVDVPFVRPASVSGDEVSLIGVLRHALSELDATGDVADGICSLQPTAPFLLPETVNTCLERFRDTGCDSVVTVRRVVHNHPYRTYERGADDALRALFPEGERFLQRQDLPPFFALSGGFYVRRAELVRRWTGGDFALGSQCLGVPVSEVESTNIDTPLDLELARVVSARQGVV